jgi:SpoVK/Ycf46/Vps4 family AAA+-type ATPase
LKKINRDPNKFNLTQLSENSDNFTGREIAQIVKESLYDAFHSKKELTTEHILNVLRKKTNIIVTMTEQMNLLFKWVGWDEEKKDGIRARYSSVPSDLEITKIQSEIDSIIGDIEKGK